MKNSRKFYDTMDDDVYLKNMEIFRRDGLVKELLAKKQIKDKNRKVKEELESQISARAEEKRLEREEQLTGQTRLFRLDAEHAARQEVLRGSRKKAATELRNTLFQIKGEQQDYKFQVGLDDEAREREFDYWRGQKQVQSNMIEQIKKDRIDEAAKIREEISETHMKIYSQKEEVIKTNFEKSLAASFQKAEAIELKKKREKEQRQQEMNEFVINHVCCRV